MAQSTTAPTEPRSVAQEDGPERTEAARYDVVDEQLTHTKRILDLQIEGSRHIYTDALRLFLLNVLALAVLLSAGMVASSLAGAGVSTASQISVVFLAFGTLALFVSMAYASRAYLGDIVDYSKPVTDTDGRDFADKSLTRNVKVIKRNARVMEAKVDAIRTSMLSMIGGVVGLALALGFQLVPLDSWAQVVVSLNALLVVGYLLTRVMDLDYIETQKERLLR